MSVGAGTGGVAGTGAGRIVVAPLPKVAEMAVRNGRGSGSKRMAPLCNTPSGIATITCRHRMEHVDASTAELH